MAAPQTTALPARTGIRGYGARTFYTLRIPDFRVLWIGNVGTMLGQWIQFAAQGYLVFSLTGSAFQVGAVGFVRGVTAVVISPFAGTITDRFSRRSVLMVMTTISASVAILVAALIITDVIAVWMLYPLSAVEGFGDAVNQPARQVMIYDVVGAEDLPNAVAVNSLGSNTMRIVGPSLAGALIAIFGIQAAFIVQAAAYSFSVWATSRIRTRGMPSARTGTTVLNSMMDGLCTPGPTATCCC